MRTEAHPAQHPVRQLAHSAFSDQDDDAAFRADHPQESLGVDLDRQKRLGLPGSLHAFLQIRSVTIFDKMPISQALHRNNTQIHGY